MAGKAFLSQQAGVALVGFMGAGKTSVGEALSRRLNWRFEDLDERITLRAGCGIEQIFREQGEPAFRSAEHAALRELLAEMEGTRMVIALGGGAFAQPENWRLLAGAPVTTVFLDAPVEELFRRCGEHPARRPLVKDLQQFQRLHELRRENYLKAAFRVETGGKDVEAVALEVAWVLGMGTAE